MSISIDKFRFIDSVKFSNASLEKLVEGLSDENFKYIDQLKCYNGSSVEDLKLLKQKGVFPCDYISNDLVFDETQLPAKPMFNNFLTGRSSISDKDYQHAQDVWNKFNIKNLGQYNALYLATDVLLLADVFV